MIFVAGFGVVFGLSGIVFGIMCYRELHKWARQCQGARIAVSYKTKVKFDVPITEVLAWANMLDKDTASTGRVIYRQGGTAIAIIKKVKGPSRIKTLGQKPKRRPSAPTMRQGTWAVNQDKETVE